MYFEGTNQHTLLVDALEDIQKSFDDHTFERGRRLFFRIDLEHLF